MLLRTVPIAVLLTSALSGSLRGSAAAAQDIHRFRSRAAFLALSAASLADSAAIRPMGAGRAHEAAMLAMVTYLDTTAGRPLGVSGTRVRWWHGFGTQAHRTAGILVDDLELDLLREALLKEKGRAGVPLTLANPRVVHAVRFLVAHEYAHLLQYRVLPPRSLSARRLNRAIECSADLLGGMMFRRSTEDLASDDSTREIAMRAASHLASIAGTPDWLDVTAHPTPRLREMCIVVGFENASALALVLRGGKPRDAAESAYVARVRSESPGILASTASIISWSLEKARQLSGLSARPGHQDPTSLSTVRDTTVPAAVARLVGVALRGEAALVSLKGPLAPRSETTYVLTASLPTPWECAFLRPAGTSTAVCTLEGNEDEDGAREVFDATVDAVSAGLAATSWVVEVPVDRRPGRRPGPDTSDHLVTMAIRGKGTLRGRRARIDVALARTLAARDLVAQQPPPFSVTISIRAR